MGLVKFSKTMEMNSGSFSVTIESGANGGKKMTVRNGSQETTVRFTAEEYEVFKTEL